MTCDQAGWVVIWDANSLQAQISFRPLDERFDAIDFSQDGKLLAVCSQEAGKAVVWDVVANKEALIIPGERGFAKIEFVANEEMIATVTGDHTLQLWPMNPLDYLTQRGVRRLTSEERAAYAIQVQSVASTDEN